MNIEIGKLLRQLRLSKGGKGFWSLRSVAKRAGISDSYLSQLETGQVKQPLPEILRKLADALRHPYLDLMKVAGYLPDETSPEIQALGKISSEILEALSDPAAVKALLLVHQNAKEIKQAIQSLLESLPKMDPEKRKAILALCQ